MRTCRRSRRRKEGKQEIPLRALQEGRLLARGEYGGGGRKKGTLGILLQALQEWGGGGLRVARRQKRKRRRQLAVLVLCKRRWRRKGPKESFSRLFTKGGFDSRGRNKDRVADIFLY